MDGIDQGVKPTLCLAELEAQITELAGHLNAANYRWLRLIAEFDRRHGWADGALHSCAHRLNFKCGLNLGAAREKVRVAHALECLPRIAAAMARGQLSYSTARALTRVAEAGTEEYLLSIALHGAAHHVETLVRHFRRVEAEELSREARQQAGRGVSYWFDMDGSLVIKGRLPALAGAVVLKALEAAMDEVPATETAVEIGEEVRLSWQARRADALALMAQESLQSRAHAEHGGSLPGGGAPGRADAARSEHGALRDRARHHPRRGNGAAAHLPCQPGQDAGEFRRETARRGTQDSGHPAGRYALATPAAAFPAARISATSMRITSGIGPTPARPSSRIWWRCAASITAWRTRAASACGCRLRESRGSCGPTALPSTGSYPSRQRLTMAPSCSARTIGSAPA
jgi:hypothetical protein